MGLQPLSNSSVTGRPGFALIGGAHPHTREIVDGLCAAGAELSYILRAADDTWAFTAQAATPVRRAASIEEILGDPSVEIVVCAARPRLRAEHSRRALEAGKHVLALKPAAIEQSDVRALRHAQTRSGASFRVWFSERLASAATLAAIKTVHAGGVGPIAHVLGLGPHQLKAPTRPDWFFDRREAGGILADIASHQVDQFLALATDATIDVVNAEIKTLDDLGSVDLCAGAAIPGDFEVWGALTLRARSSSGKTIRGDFRVDWLSPAGLGAWGDVRLFVQGERGSIEVRKVIDAAGAPGAQHMIVVDGERITRSQWDREPHNFFVHYLAELRQGASEHARAEQDRVFRTCELVLEAQALAASSRLRVQAGRDD